MSTELIKARSKLSSVKRYLKQDKLLPAIMSVHDALRTIISTPLMKHEKKEFGRTMVDVLDFLNNEPKFREVCPLVLKYEVGNEKDLLESLHTVLEDLQGSAVDDARNLLQAIEEAKSQQLQRGKQLLSRKKYKDAKTTFNKLLIQHPDDTDLKVEVGEMFLAAERWEDALDFFNQALEDFPENVHLYNRIAIALRKLEKYEEAEKYYKQAIKYVKTDPGLLFNMGRMYVDWKQWAKCKVVAQKALQLDPSFEHARKMLSFAQKKLKKVHKV